MIDSLVNETVEEILSNERQDGLDLPMQAERAARQVLSRQDLSSPIFVERLFEESIAREFDDPVIGDWYKFVRTSLVDFIGAAAKQQMGDEYDRLLDGRLEQLAPIHGGDIG